MASNQTTNERYKVAEYYDELEKEQEASDEASKTPDQTDSHAGRIDPKCESNTNHGDDIPGGSVAAKRKRRNKNKSAAIANEVPEDTPKESSLTKSKKKRKRKKNAAEK